jgi:hypothetical protein
MPNTIRSEEELLVLFPDNNQGLIDAQAMRDFVVSVRIGHQIPGPRGFQGVPGSQGSTGVQGRAGNQGAQGVPGPQGEQGHQGHQGFQGAGFQGHQGEIGIQGHQGLQGHQGFQGAGFQGHQGTQGFQGHQGNQGLQGTGLQGDQGYQGPIGGNAYRVSFTSGDIVAGILAVEHNLGIKYVGVNIYDDSDRQIIPDEITLQDVIQLEIDLGSYGAITGTWNVVVFA